MAVFLANFQIISKMSNFSERNLKLSDAPLTYPDSKAPVTDAENQQKMMRQLPEEDKKKIQEQIDVFKVKIAYKSQITSSRISLFFLLQMDFDHFLFYTLNQPFAKEYKSKSTENTPVYILKSNSTLFDCIIRYF